MRKFTKPHKIQANSLLELKRVLIRAGEALTDEGVRYGGRPVKGGNVLNALVALFWRLPPAEQSRVARDGLEMLREHQESDEPLSPTGIVQGPAKGSSPAKGLGGVTVRRGTKSRKPQGMNELAVNRD